MTIRMWNHADICELWDGPANMARDMGVKRSCAAMWKMRGRIPPRYWNRLLKAVELRHGVEIEPRGLMPCEKEFA